MGENFLKLKRRAFGLRMAKSVISALACGLFVFASLWLLSTFEIISLGLIYRFLIPLGVSVLVFLVVFFTNSTRDKSIAKRLDREFSLDERTVTMLEYASRDTGIHVLQREDADDKLSEISGSLFGRRSLIIPISAFLVSIGVLVSAFAVKPKEVPPPEIPDEYFELSVLGRAAIEELILYVRSSEMEFPYKENIALAIEELLLKLDSVRTVDEKNAVTLDAMNFIYAETDVSSSLLEYAEELWRADIRGSRELALLLNYYSWPRADEYDKFEKQLSAFSESLAPKSGDGEMLGELSIDYIKLSSAIISSLSDVGMHESDGLYTALTRLASAKENRDDGTRVWGLTALAEYMSDGGYTAASRELEATLGALGGGIFDALSTHRANTECGEYAIKRLSEILSCPHMDFERPNLSENGGDTSFPGDTEGGGGTIGGDVVYGSDDTVLDPFTNTYVKYWEILGRYESIMLGRLESGELTEEEMLALEKYFDILHNGFATDENEKN